MTIQELTEISFSFTNIRYLKPQTNSKPKNDYIFLEGAENIFFSLIIFHFNLHNKMSDGWCSIFPSNEMQHIREITLTRHSLTNQRPVSRSCYHSQPIRGRYSSYHSLIDVKFQLT